MSTSGLQKASFPEVRDSSRYLVTDNDYAFLEVASDEAWNCFNRDSPLGLPVQDYRHFVDSLSEALEMEGFTDADVRLQGSSANFFSSSAKSFPATEGDRANLFVRENGRLWNHREQATVESRVAQQWPSLKPVQRPFDSMFRLGISPDKSDLDIQVSSSLAFRKARAIAKSRRIDPNILEIENEHYNFLIKAISDFEFLNMSRWSSDWTNYLDRQVSVAFFELKGPPKTDHPASSHFKPTDWIIEVSNA